MLESGLNLPHTYRPRLLHEHIGIFINPSAVDSPPSAPAFPVPTTSLPSGERCCLPPLFRCSFSPTVKQKQPRRELHPSSVSGEKLSALLLGIAASFGFRQLVAEGCCLLPRTATAGEIIFLGWFLPVSSPTCFLVVATVIPHCISVERDFFPHLKTLLAAHASSSLFFLAELSTSALPCVFFSDC